MIFLQKIFAYADIRLPRWCKLINLNGLILQKSQELLPLHVALPIPILYSDCMNVRTLSSWSSSGWTIPPMSLLRIFHSFSDCCFQSRILLLLFHLHSFFKFSIVINGTDPQLFRQAVCLLKRELFGGFPCIPVKHQRGWLSLWIAISIFLKRSIACFTPFSMLPKTFASARMGKTVLG